MEQINFSKSRSGHHKYQVITPSGRTIHFGDRWYEHYKDTTPLGLFKHLDHLDQKRRSFYLKRHSKIVDKDGNLVYKDPESPSYYSWKYLWDGPD